LINVSSVFEKVCSIIAGLYLVLGRSEDYVKDIPYVIDFDLWQGVVDLLSVDCDDLGFAV
jgi:hypothetical protein